MNQRKFIQNHLDRVHSEIVSCFGDGHIQRFIKHKTYFAGGCFVSLFHKENPSDYDIYFYNESDAKEFHKFVGEPGDFYKYRPVGKKKPSSIFGVGAVPRIVANTDRAVTIEMTDQNGINIKVQFITRWAGAPLKIVDSFDFVHTQCYYTPGRNDLYMRNEMTLSEKQLLFNKNAGYPVHSIFRIEKFIKRGFTIQKNTAMHIAKAITKLNLDDKAVLKEQSIGMYQMTDAESPNFIDMDNDHHKKYLFDQEMYGIVND